MIRILLSGIAALLISVTSLQAGSIDSDMDKNSFFLPNSEQYHIPYNIARLKSVQFGASNKTVFLIRDIHAQYEAQSNIARLIVFLNDVAGLTHCYVEGHSGAVDLSPMAAFPDDTIRIKVSDEYLQNGKINGEEYVLITEPSKLLVSGIEDLKTYEQNLNAYRQTLSYTDIVSWIDDQITECVAMPSPYRELIANLSDFLSFSKQASVYMQYLNMQHEWESFIDEEMYSNIALYMRADAVLKRINFEKLEREHAVIMDHCADVMPEDMYSQLTRLDLQSRVNIIDDRRFYGILKTLASYHNDFQDTYPSFALYCDYLSLISEINYTTLTSELISLTRSSVPADAVQPMDRLVALYRLKKIIECELPHEEARDFVQSEDFISNLLSHIKELSSYPQNRERLTQALSYCSEHYRLALLRDEILAENLMDQMADQQKGICIAGGFHSDAICQRLLKDGYTVITIEPAASAQVSKSCYLNVIKNTLTETEALFSMEHSTLRQPSLEDRPEHNFGVQLEMLKEYLTQERDKEKAKPYLLRLIVDAAYRKSQALELMDEVAIFEDASSLYVLFGKHKFYMQIEYGVDSQPKLLFESQAELPADVQSINLHYTQLALGYAKIDSTEISGATEFAENLMRSIPFYDAQDYFQFLVHLKQHLTGYFWQDEMLRLVIYEAILEYVGYQQPDEMTEESVAERFDDARIHLKHIYKSEAHRENFVLFLSEYQTANFYYNNYLTPLFIAAMNHVAGQALSSNEIVRAYPNLFTGNLTVKGHPWFGANRTSLPVVGETVQTPPVTPKGETLPGNKKRLRVLLIGARQNDLSTAPPVILKRYLQTVFGDAWDEIYIESQDFSFLAEVHPFDPVNGHPLDSVRRFDFDGNGVFVDPDSGVVYRKINYDDPLYDPHVPGFSPQQQYDIVITSDIGIGAISQSDVHQTVVQNMGKLLDDRGMLFYGKGFMTLGVAAQRQGDQVVEHQEYIPFYNRATILRKLRYINTKNSIMNPADTQLIEQALHLRVRLQGRENPAFDITTYAMFLTEFGEEPLTIIAFLLQDLSNDLIINAFPHHHEIILRIRERFTPVTFGKRWEHVFPHLVNLANSDPSNWKILDSDDEAKEKFLQSSGRLHCELYSNGVYTFELGFHNKNAVVFITKTAGLWKSVKVIIVSDPLARSKDLMQQQIDNIAELVSVAEREDTGSIPQFLPALEEYEPDAQMIYRQHWDSAWKTPSPKYLHIGGSVIQHLAVINPDNISVYKGRIFSREMAVQFMTHPLVESNIRDAAKIFVAVYYLNPQIASIILRSLPAIYMPKCRMMLMHHVINEQIARMLDIAILDFNPADRAKFEEVKGFKLLQLLAPSREFGADYMTNIGDVFQHMRIPTIVSVIEQVHELVQHDFREGWAVSLLAQVYHRAPIVRDTREHICEALSPHARSWLTSQTLKLTVEGDTPEQIHHKLNDFIDLNDLIEALREETAIDFDYPSENLQKLVEQYRRLKEMGDALLDGNDRDFLYALINDYQKIGPFEYNPYLTVLFLQAFKGATHFDESGYAFRNIYLADERLAGIILRSTNESQHFYTGCAFFALPPAKRAELLAKELIEINYTNKNLFEKIDKFALFTMVGFRHFINETEKLPHDLIVDTLHRLDDATLKNLFHHAYFYVQSTSTFVDIAKNFSRFVADNVGYDRVLSLFPDNSTLNRDIRVWLSKDILGIDAVDEEELLAALEQHPDYERIRSMNIKIDNIDTPLNEITTYMHHIENEFPQTAEKIRLILLNLERSQEMFQRGYYSRGILAWGKGIDLFDTMVKSNQTLSEAITVRLTKLYTRKLDQLFSSYVSYEGLARFKSVLPYSRKKVVGKLRIIPDSEEGFRMLFDNELLAEGFAVVGEYPQNMATMAKPRAIIAEVGMGRDEHAAERAADWKIPYVIIPRARKMLANLVRTDEQDVWITLEIGGRTPENVIRRATPQEIMEEQRYRLKLEETPTEDSIVVTPIEPDLSVTEVRMLSDIGMDDYDKFGPKTARIAEMMNNGLPVKDGFALPFGLYELFATHNNLKTQINVILGQPDFQTNRLQYLSQIQKLILNAEFPPEVIEAVRQAYERIGGGTVIDRSSTNAEDLSRHAGAGVHESFPNLQSFDEVIRGIKEVYASVWSELAYDNRVKYSMPHMSVYPAVLVQQMSPALYSGVMNTANELTYRHDEFTVSVNVGAGGGVEGLSAEYVFSRSQERLLHDETDIPDFLLDTPVSRLTDNDFTRLEQLGHQVATLFGNIPQKIEFSFDKDGYWVHQSKDLPSFKPEEEIEEPTPTIILSDDSYREAIAHDMTIINADGVFLDPAQMIVDTVSRYDAEVHIVKLTSFSESGTFILLEERPVGDAKKLISLLNLKLKKGEQVKLLAQGRDAEMTLEALSELINARFQQPSQPDDLADSVNTIYHHPRYATEQQMPQFRIAQILNSNGLHARPSTYLCKTAQQFQANIKLRKITVDPESGEETYGDSRNPKMPMELLMLLGTPGSRIEITAEGEDAQDAIIAVQRVFINNLGDPSHPNDIRVDQAIQNGAFLSRSEKNAVDTVLTTMHRAVSEIGNLTVSTLTFDAYTQTVGYFSKDTFVPIAIDPQVMTLFQQAILRDALGERYLRHALNDLFRERYPIDIVTEPMTDSPQPKKFIISSELFAASL